MLRLAVKRDGRHAAKRGQVKKEIPTATEQNAYLICDARSKGCPIRHVSKGLEALVGCNADEFVGSGCNQILGGKGLSQDPAAAALNKAAATAGIEAKTSIDRIAKAAEKAVQSAVGGGSAPVLLINANRSGDLFVCELSMCKNQHPTLGWSYHAGILRDVSGDISVTKLLASAQDDGSYERLCSEWAQAKATRGMPSSWSSSLKDELNAVAEAMWKDELSKGIKPKASHKSVDADMSSIWSRSTASTLSSRSGKNPSKDTAEKAFHFGALLGSMQGVEHTAETSEWSDDVARKRFAPATETRSVRRRETKLGPGDDDEFQSASEDEKDAWEDCQSLCSEAIHSTSPASTLLIADVVDPVKHVDRSVLRNMKIPFVLAAPTVKGFPICLRSKGFEDLLGPSMHVKMGCDARDVLKPSQPKDSKVWQSFFDSILQGQFYVHENESMLDGYQVPDDRRLPSGELKFMQTFHGRFGNPMECVVRLKHIELDDCPFLLALHAYLPGDAEDSSLEKLYGRLNERLDEVIAEMASEYVYYAPMRRQGKYHP